MTARAFIAGCSGLQLTPDEIAFFRESDPWGFILFRRNVDSPEQVRALCGSLRDTVGRSDAPILIDQEGGRVQRLGPPHWPKYPPGSAYGRVHADDPLVLRFFMPALELRAFDGEGAPPGPGDWVALPNYRDLWARLAGSGAERSPT